MTGLNCVFSLFVTVMNRSSRKRDRFTVRPSDYISDSVTAPSSTATACFLSLSLIHTHTRTHTGRMYLLAEQLGCGLAEWVRQACIHAELR